MGFCMARFTGICEPDWTDSDLIEIFTVLVEIYNVLMTAVDCEIRLAY